MRRFPCRLVWLSLGCVCGLMLVAAKPTTSHLLGWETQAAPLDGFLLEQCVVMRQACVMQPLASFGAATVQAEVIGLGHNRTYCWRIQPYAQGHTYAYSNTVCAG